MRPIDIVDYEIDRDDRLVRLNPAWSAFAAANGAPHLRAEDLLGRSIWSYIADDTTRQVYRVLVERVRYGETTTFPFRCDSPDLRRFMMMRMSPVAEQGVRFASATIRVEPRSFQRFWSAAEPRDTSLVHTCGWCKRVTADGVWMEVEDAVTRLGLFNRERVPELTHGMCPQCLQAVLGQAGQVSL